MRIKQANFRPAENTTWDGRTLRNKNLKLTCIRNLAEYKLFVEKKWSGNGFGIDTDYFVVRLADGEVYRFHPPVIAPKLAEVVAFLEHHSI